MLIAQRLDVARGGGHDLLHARLLFGRRVDFTEHVLHVDLQVLDHFVGSHAAVMPAAAHAMGEREGAASGERDADGDEGADDQAFAAFLGGFVCMWVLRVWDGSSFAPPCFA